MDKALRPADDYWAGNGVYAGAQQGYVSPGDLVKPMYALVYLPAGYRPVIRGAWEVVGGSATPDYALAAGHMGNMRQEVASGKRAALALVAIISHPDEGEDYLPAVTVCDLSVSRVVQGGPEWDCLPGLNRVRELMTDLYRSMHGLNPADFVRPEPPAPVQHTNPTEDTDTEHSGEVPHNPAYGP